MLNMFVLTVSKTLKKTEIIIIFYKYHVSICLVVVYFSTFSDCFNIRFLDFIIFFCIICFYVDRYSDILCNKVHSASKNSTKYDSPNFMFLYNTLDKKDCVENKTASNCFCFVRIVNLWVIKRCTTKQIPTDTFLLYKIPLFYYRSIVQSYLLYSVCSMFEL